MKISIFCKTLFLLAFTTLFFFIGTSCQIDEPTVTIRGIVTITRDGKPYNESLPTLTAHNRSRFETKPNKSTLLGWTWVNHRETTVQIGDGLFEWFMDIPYKAISSDIYFEIQTFMHGVDATPSTNYPIKSLAGIRINDADSIIDLGTVNFQIIQLSGSLPVTINGEPAGGIMHIGLPNNQGLAGANINPEGLWSCYVLSPDPGTPIGFSISTQKGEARFFQRIDTEIDTNINNYGENIHFIFPEYPNINFQAFTISGTIKVPNIRKSQPWEADITFYDEDNSFNDWWGLGGAEIEFLRPNGDGSGVWTGTVRAFPIPQRLNFRVSGSRGNDFASLTSTVKINNETDLNNVNLGTFSKWGQNIQADRP